MRPMLRPKELATLAGILLLAGCGHSPATTFLVLDPAPVERAIPAYTGPPLRVPFVHLPITLDRPELVRRDAAGTLKVDDFARWSAPLGRMARDTLIQDLIQRLPAGQVLPPDAPPAPREVRVEATILSFDAGAGTAAITVSYRLVALGAVGSRPMVAQFTAPLPDETPAGRARAWSALLGQLSDRIVADLPRPR